MNPSPEFDVDVALATELENLRRQFPQQFSKTIRSLAASDETWLQTSDDELSTNDRAQCLNLTPFKLRTLDVSQLSKRIRRTEKRIEQHQAEAERERNLLVELRILRELAGQVHNRESSHTFNRQVVNDPYSYDDFSSMPLCSERSLFFLLFHVSLQVTDRTASLRCHPAQLEREIEKEFVHLRDRLRIEELESRDIDSLVKTAMTNTQSRNWESVLTVLKQILQRINPLNTHELFRLVREIDDTAHLIKGKDVILFLGETGVGKSTTIHFLSGSQMVRTVVQGLNHLEPQKITNPEARKIIISPCAQSVSRCVASVTIDPKDVEISNRESIVLCDTPGFEDTRGVEVDIANGVSIVRAIRECRSVKPVVLISYRRIGDRLDGLKKLSRALTQMMPNVQDHIRTFSYLFTKFPSNEKDTIHALLTEAKRTINEVDQFTPGLIALLTDMIKKTEKDPHALDPLTDDPRELLHELTDSYFIDRLEDVFQPIVSEKSRALVQEQVRKDQLRIICATKRADYLLIKYKLDQLKHLDDLLAQEFITKSYDESLRHLREHLSNEYQKATASIDRWLTDQALLRSEEIRHYHACMVHATVAEQLLGIHLGKDVVRSERLLEHLNHKVDTIVTELGETEIDDSSLKQRLDKLKLLPTSFPELEVKYRHVCDVLAKKLELVVKSGRSSVLSNQFDVTASDLTKLRAVSVTLQEHLTHISIEAVYLHLKEHILQHLHQSLEKSTELFRQATLEQSNIDRLNSCVCILESAKNTADLHSHIPREEINRIFESLVSRAVDYYEEIVRKVRERLENENPFHIAEEWVKTLEMIRTVSTFEHRTSRSYSHLWENIVSSLHDSTRTVEELLRSVSRLESKVNDEKLKEYLSSLANTQWIEKYRPGVYVDVTEIVKKKLIACAVEMKESVVKMSLEFDQFGQIESASRLVEKIEWLTQFENIAPGILQHSVEINTWLETAITNAFVSIQMTFSKTTGEELGYRAVDWKRAEKAFQYLEMCKKTRLSLTSAFSALEEFVVSYYHFVQKEMEHSFDTIKQYPSKNKDEILEQARLLSVRWQELLEIKTKYIRVFSCSSNRNIMEDWENQLFTYLSDIEDEMHLFSISLQMKALQDKLVVLKVLSLFDRFFAGEKYRNVYNTYQKIFFTRTRATFDQIVDDIGKRDYERVDYEMRTLQLSGDIGDHFFVRAQQALNVSVGNLCEETKTRALLLRKNLDSSEVKSLVDNLRRIQRAEKFTADYLDRSQDLDECVREIQSLIEDRMQQSLKNITALISVHSFRHAEEELASIEFIRRLLGRYCTERVSTDISEMQFYQRQFAVDQIIEQVATRDISDYFIYPPIELFSRLAEASSTNPIYSNALNRIREIIGAKLMEELEKARLAQVSSSSNIHLRRF